ncbi:MAG: phosphatidylinositol-specific phospholipase C/glycerophosphodiester phosphodiesterase family protein [Alphaproteobacteria bacterium]
MIKIVHRVNTVRALADVPAKYGVEIDIRSSGDDLILHHDPFQTGETFADWITHYDHRMLILNVKEEGLEARLLDIMAAQGIEDFFFLDQSFPFLIKTSGAGEKRSAVRISEYESIELALSLAGRVDWVWVDCFSRFPLDAEMAERLTAAGFKLCFVSPELQGRTGPDAVRAMRDEIQHHGITGHAVCTKTPDLWN